MRPPVIKTLTRSRGVLLLCCPAFSRFGILFLERGTETLTHARAAEQDTLVTHRYLEGLYRLNLCSLSTRADSIFRRGVSAPASRHGVAPNARVPLLHSPHHTRPGEW